MNGFIKFRKVEGPIENSEICIQLYEILYEYHDLEFVISKMIWKS